MEKKLDGLKVAILVTGGFEQVELVEPKKALEDAGAKITIIAPIMGEVQGMHHDRLADSFKVDVVLEQAQADDYDALLLPGGVINSDRLRIIPKAVGFVKRFIDGGKPLAAICHAPWILIETGAARGRRLTSWPTLKTDLVNAGAKWTDEEVVVDQGLVTSRKPDDIPAFNAKMIEEFAEGRHAKAVGGDGDRQVRR
jgi:protease I